MNPQHFKRHIFFCTNQRNDGRASCGDHNSHESYTHCKIKIKEQGLAGKGKLRVNHAGCLDHCDKGPVCVVYPDAVWYQYVDQHDIDEIIESHLKNGIAVKRLMI